MLFANVTDSPLTSVLHRQHPPARLPSQPCCRSALWRRDLTADRPRQLLRDGQSHQNGDGCWHRPHVNAFPIELLRPDAAACIADLKVLLRRDLGAIPLLDTEPCSATNYASGFHDRDNRARATPVRLEPASRN